MYPFIISLFIIPTVVSGLLLVFPKKLSGILIIATSIVLSGISLYLFLRIKEPFYFGVPAYMNSVISGADILLLLYFGSVAIRKKSWLVGLLTILQLGTLIYLLTIIPGEHEMQFTVDKLSVFM